MSVRAVIAAVLLIGGVLSELFAVWGVFKFRFVMNRMHCAAVIDALSLGLILIGLAVLGGKPYLPKLAFILILQWVASPIASHMVGRLETETEPEKELLSHMQAENVPSEAIDSAFSSAEKREKEADREHY